MARIVKRIGKKGTVSYLIRVSCGYDAEGRQVTKSTTWHPDPEMPPRQREREAARFALDYEKSVLGGGCEQLSGTRLRDFCGEYLTIYERLLSPQVYDYYRHVIDERIVPSLGAIRMRDLHPIHVQRFIGELQSAPVRGHAEQHLSAASVHRYFTVLKSIMALAFKLGYISSNPTASAKLTLPPVEEPEVAVFTEEECLQMLEALETEPLKWQVLINLAVVTGARRGELCALRWEDIDLARHILRINGSSYRLPGGTVQVKAPKTKKSVRTVTFDNYCAELLTVWQDAQGDERGEWVFPGRDGAPMDPARCTEWFKLFQKRHGIAHHKFHSLRHTSGTLLLLRGTNIKTVASRLGHTQLATVNRYVHALEAADIAAAATFDSLRSAVKKGI